MNKKLKRLCAWAAALCVGGGYMLGGGLVNVTAEMSEAQLRKYIALADEVDCEA